MDEELPRRIATSDLGQLKVIPESGDAAPPATVCGACGGSGWYKQAVPYSHPHFGVLFPCECKQAEQAQRRRDELLRLSNLAALQDKTFKTFSPGVNGTAARGAWACCRDYARRPERWLVMVGPVGAGKTHLAAAIANAALARGQQVLFSVVPDLLDHLRATFGPSSETDYDARFELVRTVELLVLDDLGTENATPWAREKLYQLINHRYNTRLPTVVTSNRPECAIDARIRSRMADMLYRDQWLVVNAPDYRRQAVEATKSAWPSLTQEGTQEGTQDG